MGIIRICTTVLVCGLCLGLILLALAFVLLGVDLIINLVL